MEGGLGMRTAIVTVILVMLVVMIFYASYLWDRVVELEEELERRGHG
jgi:hypothetical protein